MTQMMEYRKTIQSISIESRQIVRRLSVCVVGELIEYKELSELIGADVQREKRHALYTARNRLLRDEGMVFGVIRNSGIRRLNDPEIVTESENSLKRNARISKTGMLQLICVNYNELSPEEKMAWNSRMALLQATNLMSKPSSIRQLETKLNRRPQLEETLNFFRKIGKQGEGDE